MKKLLAFSTALTVALGNALAGGVCDDPFFANTPTCDPTVVPEMSAVGAVAAFAAVASVVAIAVERRRRAK